MRADYKPGITSLEENTICSCLRYLAASNRLTNKDWGKPYEEWCEMVSKVSSGLVCLIKVTGGGERFVIKKWDSSPIAKSKSCPALTRLVNELKLIELFCELDDFCTSYQQQAATYQLTAATPDRRPNPPACYQPLRNDDPGNSLSRKWQQVL